MVRHGKAWQGKAGESLGGSDPISANVARDLRSPYATTSNAF